VNYEKMQREAVYVESRKKSLNSKRKWKDIAKVARQRRDD